jgi:hypothetical protein
MSEFHPIVTLEDLILQPACEVTAGYMTGLHNKPEPGSDKSRAFWHGWRNGLVDGGYTEPDAAQEELMRRCCTAHRAN